MSVVPLRGRAPAVMERVNEALDAALEDLAIGRRDVAVTNLAHALRIVVGMNDEGTRIEVPPQTAGRLDQIVREGGGFR